MSASEINNIGFCDDDPVTLSDGRVVRARSSSRFGMLCTIACVLAVWVGVNTVNAALAIAAALKAADGPAAVTVAVIDFPWVAAVLIVLVILAKDKPLDRIAEIAGALKR